MVTLKLDNEIERLAGEILAGRARHVGETARTHLAENGAVLPPELAQLRAMLERRAALTPIWATLKQAVDASVGRDDTDWLAVECIVALLEFLEHGPIGHPVVDQQTVVKAHAMLASVATRSVLILATQIEWAIDRATRAGAGEAEWVTAAKDLADRHGKRAEDLAERLQGNIMKEKQGRVPNGRYTTGMIVAWLTGDENKRKLLNDARGDKAKESDQRF